MRVLRLWLCVFPACLLLAMCSPGNNNGNGDGGGTDAPAGKACVSVRDCPNQDCVNGRCTRTIKCTSHDECKDGQRCYDGDGEDKSRCAVICNIDTDCPAEHVCTDGMCHKPDWKKGKPPVAAGASKKPLQAGLAVVQLNHPLGISMAGYGFRPGDKGPYANALGASTGIYDRMQIKALALDNGKERLVLVRSPLCFTTDFFVQGIMQEIIKRTGVDYTKNTIITGTHSHSAPARFWNLLPDLGFGAFGGGDFMPEVYRRMRDSFADAIIKANENLKPAKIGYTVDRDFDKENMVFSNRRSENGAYKHPHLLVMRIDKENGDPLAAVVSYPIHGTISGNNNLTNDSVGGSEFKLQERLEQKLGKRVEVLHMQANAGDISPRGDRMGHKLTQQMQMMGHLAAIHIEKLYSKIKPKSDVEMEVADRRVPLSRKAIGYTGEQFYNKFGDRKRLYQYGAFQCVSKGFDFRKQPDKRHEDGKMQCAFSIQTLHGAPVPQFSKARFTAFRLDDLVVGTLPGESTANVAKRFRDGVLKGNEGKVKEVFSFGYSQDHHLYILDEEDWWRGGYEASMSIWGSKVGEYMIKEAVGLTRQLLTPEKEKNDTGIKALDFYKLDMTKSVEREETPDAGKVLVQPPKTYMRMAKPISFKLSGGFLGVDNPRVTLQKEEGGSFKDVTYGAGRPYDDTDYRIVMTFEKNKKAYEYTFAFEELQNFPAGTYRFRYVGKQWKGGKAVEYKGETDAFTIAPSDKLRVYKVAYDKGSLQAWVAYPAGTTADEPGDFKKLEPIGHLLRSPLVHREIGPPLPEKEKASFKVTVMQGGKTVDTLTADATPAYQVIDHATITSREKGKETKGTRKGLGSGFTLKPAKAWAAGTYQVTIEVTDKYGNTGTWGPKPVTVK